MFSRKRRRYVLRKYPQNLHRTATLLRDCSIDVYKVAQSAVVLALVHQQCGELRYLHVQHNAILNYDYLHSRRVCCLSVDARRCT